MSGSDQIHEVENLGAVPVLEIISGHGQGKRMKVETPCIIGRSMECDFVITDNKISRHHMIIRPVRGGLIVRDLGSKNGVFLNGRRIKDDEWVKHGDVVLVGETFIQVQYPRSITREKYGSHYLITVSTAATTHFDEISIPEKLKREHLTEEDLNILMELLSLAREVEDQVTSLKRVTRRLIDLFKAESAVLCLCTKTDYEPAIILSREKKAHFLNEILQSTLMQRKGVLINNAHTPHAHTHRAGRIPRHVPASQMCAPFIHNGRIAGLIALGAKRPFAFPKSSLNLLTVLANHLATNVARASEDHMPERIRAIERHGDTQVLIGDGDAMKQLKKLITQVAPQPVSVLITGPTGCGKELVARAIHTGSQRADGAFICVNCAAIPEDIFEAELFGYEKGAYTGAYQAKPGKFELASNGTLFFDEIGDLSIDMQPKLLRVLETQEFMHLGGIKVLKTNVRFLFATNRNLREMVNAGTFREDLFFRIHTFDIPAPPLKERLEDIPDLSDYFLDKIQEQLNRSVPFRFTSAVLGSFLAYDWPGNVRELRNVLEQMAVLSESELLDEELLPTRILVGAQDQQIPSIEEYPQGPGLLTSVTDQTQKQLVLHALKEAKGQKKRAAEILGISRPTLDKKIRLFGIKNINKA